MDPLNNYTTTRGRPNGLLLQVVLIFWGQKTSMFITLFTYLYYICDVIWQFLLNCYGCSTYSVNFFFKPIKRDKVLYKEIFLLLDALISFNFCCTLFQRCIHKAIDSVHSNNHTNIVKTSVYTFKGHQVNISCKRHTYTITTSYHLPLVWWPSGLRCSYQFLGHLWCDPH